MGCRNEGMFRNNYIYINTVHYNVGLLEIYSSAHTFLSFKSKLHSIMFTLYGYRFPLMTCRLIKHVPILSTVKRHGFVKCNEFLSFPFSTTRCQYLIKNYTASKFDSC